MCVYDDNDNFFEKDLYEKCKNVVEERKIYTNVFNCVSKCADILKMTGCKIAYGYLEVEKDLYLRMPVLVRKGKVVDVNRQLYDEQERSRYYIFEVMEIDEYANRVLKEQGDVTLKAILGEQESEIGKKLEEKEIAVLK